MVQPPQREGYTIIKRRIVDKAIKQAFKDAAKRYKETGRFSDRIRLSMAAHEAKLFLHEPILEEDVLKEIVRLEDTIDFLENKDGLKLGESGNRRTVF